MQNKQHMKSLNCQRSSYLVSTSKFVSLC